MSLVPLIGPDRQDSQQLRATGYDLLKPGFLDTLGAGVASDSATAGIGAVVRMGDMYQAQGRPQAIGRGGFYPGKPVTPVGEEEWKGSPDYREGLAYFPGMTKEAAKLLAERHDTDAARADIMNRDEGGVVRTGLLYATRFAAQMADPINIMASFVPVVGEARFARMMAQYGRTPARLIAGGIEGTVGNALLEPLFREAAAEDQRDYSMLDSLVNVGLGGLLGAGIRAGGGALADVVARRGGRRVAEAAGDVAITQVTAGKEVDVAPVFRAASEAERPAAPGSSFDAGRDPILAQRAADRQAVDEMRAAIRAGQAEDASRPMTFEQRRQMAQKELLDAYPSREIKLTSDKKVIRKGPIDLATYIRIIGGIREDGAETAGIAEMKRGRAVQFAKGEQFLGALIRPDGLSLEEATRRAAHAGFIGKSVEQVNEYGEVGVADIADTGELIDALERTLAAGDNIEGRVWGVTDDGPIQDYIARMREIDMEESFAPVGAERYQPLDGEEEVGFDPIDLEGIDDPEELWRQEMERAGLDTQAKPDTPEAMSMEQEIAAVADQQKLGYDAAAMCIGRALS